MIEPEHVSVEVALQVFGADRVVDAVDSPLRVTQIVTTKTLRRRFFSLAGRLTRSARRLTLHLPKRRPWEEQFSRALARLQVIPLPA